MRQNWLIRGLCLALAAISLGGCVVIPARPFYRPAYYYR